MKTRSSRPEVFCEKGVLRNFAKFTGNHLCQSQSFRRAPANLLKKRLWHRFLPVNFAKFRRTPFFTEHLWCLLLEHTCSVIFVTEHLCWLLLEIYMCFLIEKHVFVHFLNNQKLSIQFNQIDVIVGKSLVKHMNSLLITFLKNVENF